MFIIDSTVAFSRTFPRAIRNTIECTLHEHSIVMNRIFDALAALQLLLLIKWRCLRSFLSSDSHASMKSELGKLRVNCKIKIEPDIDS